MEPSGLDVELVPRSLVILGVSLLKCEICEDFKGNLGNSSVAPLSLDSNVILASVVGFC